MKQRVFNILLALDHFVFALVTLGNVKPFEMMSSALWSLEQDGRAIGQLLRPMVDAALFIFTGPAHCRKSYEWQIQLSKDKQ